MRPFLALIFVVFPALYAIAESELAPREDAPAHPFLPIAEVLRNPRCLNCHVNGDTPKQTDARRAHIPSVKGGADGKGSGMKCATCHREKPGVVPGAPGWRLAPLSMAWEGLSDADLCRTLTDQTKNGGKDPAAIAQHILTDGLVAYGWNPGGNRAHPGIERRARHDPAVLGVRGRPLPFQLAHKVRYLHGRRRLGKRQG